MTTPPNPNAAPTPALPSPVSRGGAPTPPYEIPEFAPGVGLEAQIGDFLDLPVPEAEVEYQLYAQRRQEGLQLSQEALAHDEDQFRQTILGISERTANLDRVADPDVLDDTSRANHDRDERIVEFDADALVPQPLRPARIPKAERVAPRDLRQETDNLIETVVAQSNLSIGLGEAAFWRALPRLQELAVAGEAEHIAERFGVTVQHYEDQILTVLEQNGRASAAARHAQAERAEGQRERDAELARIAALPEKEMSAKDKAKASRGQHHHHVTTHGGAVRQTENAQNIENSRVVYSEAQIRLWQNLKRIFIDDSDPSHPAMVVDPIVPNPADKNKLIIPPAVPIETLADPHGSRRAINEDVEREYEHLQDIIDPLREPNPSILHETFAMTMKLRERVTQLDTEIEYRRKTINKFGLNSPENHELGDLHYARQRYYRLFNQSQYQYAKATMQSAPVNAASGQRNFEGRRIVEELTDGGLLVDGGPYEPMVIYWSDGTMGTMSSKANEDAFRAIIQETPDQRALIAGDAGHFWFVRHSPTGRLLPPPVPEKISAERYARREQRRDAAPKTPRDSAGMAAVDAASDRAMQAVDAFITGKRLIPHPDASPARVLIDRANVAIPGMQFRAEARVGSEVERGLRLVEGYYSLLALQYVNGSGPRLEARLARLQTDIQDALHQTPQMGRAMSELATLTKLRYETSRAIAVSEDWEAVSTISRKSHHIAVMATGEVYIPSREEFKPVRDLLGLKDGDWTLRPDGSAVHTTGKGKDAKTTEYGILGVR